LVNTSFEPLARTWLHDGRGVVKSGALALGAQRGVAMLLAGVALIQIA
jgi:hypothetical protein